jgi:putative redox protein
MATQVKIKNLPYGYQSFITNGKHTLVGDEPIKSKGTDLGMSPSELVLSGLALCKVATVRYIARKNGWEIGDVYAELTQNVKRSSTSMTTVIDIDLKIEGNITEEQKLELMEQADHCYIHRQLVGDWKINSVNELQEEIM